MEKPLQPEKFEPSKEAFKFGKEVTASTDSLLTLFLIVPEDQRDRMTTSIQFSLDRLQTTLVAGPHEVFSVDYVKQLQLKDLTSDLINLVYGLHVSNEHQFYSEEESEVVARFLAVYFENIREDTTLPNTTRFDMLDGLLKSFDAALTQGKLSVADKIAHNIAELSYRKSFSCMYKIALEERRNAFK